MNKYFSFLLLLTLISHCNYAQDLSNNIQNTVTITVSGQGKSLDEAKNNALRSAIEQAFGTFISSKTEILNDSLIKDEIVSVTNGNIQNFQVLNETLLPNGIYTVTLKALVSVEKLTSFCESRGVKVEFKGGLFAMNIALLELNQKSEKIAWENTFKMIINQFPISYSFKIETQQPIRSQSEKWSIPIQVYISTNNNYDEIVKQIVSFANSVSLSAADRELYNNSKIPYFEIKINNIDYYFRNKNILDDLKEIPSLLLKDAIQNLEISNGIDNYTLLNLCIKNPNNDIELYSNKIFGSGYCWWGGNGKRIIYSILENSMENYYIEQHLNIKLNNLLNDKSQFTISNRNHFKIGGANYDCLINKIDYNILRGEIIKIMYSEAHTIDAIKNITSYTIKKRS